MRAWILVAALAACGGKTETTDDTGGGDAGDGGAADGGSASFDDYIDVTDPPSGDFTGFEGGYDAAGGWLSQAVDPEKQVTAPFAGTVEDFQEGTAVADATVEMWFNDSVSGAPDAIGASDSDGAVALSDVPVCAPLTYRTSTDPDLDETKNTIEAHQVYDYTDGTIDDTLNSVSTTTYRLIPGLLGVDPDPARGIIAGTAYDVNEDKIEGAQVIVQDADGNIPDGLVVHYFIDDFPNRDQPTTSADGLWVAINVPVGDWNVDMYVSDGAGGHLLMGRTTLTVEADSINIANIYTGYGDGVKYPDGCLKAK